MGNGHQCKSSYNLELQYCNISNTTTTMGNLYVVFSENTKDSASCCEITWYTMAPSAVGIMVMLLGLQADYSNLFGSIVLKKIYTSFTWWLH